MWETKYVDFTIALLYLRLDLGQQQSEKLREIKNIFIFSKFQIYL